MTPELAQFSDWVLALLPRLFIYPGGLWLLAGVLLARLSGGRLWLHAFTHANLSSLTVAWAAVALLPLPGAQPLPVSVDRWVLAAMLVLSLLLDIGAQHATMHIALAGAAITLAILSPLAADTSLIGTSVAYVSTTPWAVGVEILAIAFGITTMIVLGNIGISADVRGIAWLALVLLPLFGSRDMWPIVTLWVLGAAGLLSFVAVRLKPLFRNFVVAQVILWLLGFLALVGPLFAAR